MKTQKIDKRPIMEFSKKIFVGVSTLVAYVVVFTSVMVWITRDLTPLMYLIPAVFAELATATAYYYNKAKHENIEKIKGAEYIE